MSAVFCTQKKTAPTYGRAEAVSYVGAGVLLAPGRRAARVLLPRDHGTHVDRRADALAYPSFDERKFFPRIAFIHGDLEFLPLVVKLEGEKLPRIATGELIPGRLSSAGKVPNFSLDVVGRMGAPFPIRHTEPRKERLENLRH